MQQVNICANGKQARSNKAYNRYSLKPFEKREMAEMAQRAPKVDRALVKMLSLHFGVAQKIVVEVLERHQICLDGLATEMPDRPAEVESKPKRKKLGLCKSEPKAKTEPAQEPKADEAPSLKEEWGKVAIEKTTLERKRVELERREAALLQREKAVEAMEEDGLTEGHREETPEVCEAEPEVCEPLPREKGATEIKIWNWGMVYQALAVREAKIAEHKRDLVEARAALDKALAERDEANGNLDRALDLLEQRAQPKVVEEMPGWGPIKSFGDYYLRLKAEPTD